ncbi:uncharacterized protein BCR38DRAFT_351323 [Pseudomassariella vexata]|uniref:Distal membrane-arm assembly complex protein 1-like domain-containing protein n=1 Tax=Pseudomassariella vexata TaxID=1141098 RepID=A0A1Y2DKB6_9PEZI|nr:uncharacterized protein BCR38DRAFT_351323 [Pseudomassariella vexata]ORY59614.1 hypothetical protein BCR38DRAFT_351323 [Pseudomassariella vexata]
MAGDKIPNIGHLDKPENYKELLKADRGEDCVPCRVVGGGAFIGLAAYSYFSGNKQLEKQQTKILASKSMFGMRSRRFGIAGTSLGLVWLGIYRMFM